MLICEECRIGPCLPPAIFQLVLHNSTLCSIAVYTGDKMTHLILTCCRYTIKCYSVVIIKRNVLNMS